MDIVRISQEIGERIRALKVGRGALKDLANRKAEMVANYDKTLAIAILKLKSGSPMEVEGITIESPPATLIEKIAKGMCWAEKLEMDKAESLFKSAITKIHSIMGEMNALQTLYKQQEEL